MRIIGFILILFLAGFHLEAQTNFKPYLGQEPQGLTPEVFAKGLISTNEFEFGSTFSKDGKTFYYAVDLGGYYEIRFSSWENNKWSKPKVLLGDGKYTYNNPMLNPREDRLYFISNRPMNGTGDAKDVDIWYVQRTLDGWSEPINVGAPINTERNEYYMSFTSNGDMYFSSEKDDQGMRGNFNIYKSTLVNGEFQAPMMLPAEINGIGYEADVFIAPDESYIIFAANRKSSLGSGDLYVSFKQEDGTWTQSQNMGPSINNETNQFCPFVSADGKYLFYSSRSDIYWVSTKVFEGYR